MIELRNYQNESISQLKSLFSDNLTGKFILQSPTGTGKTIMFVSMGIGSVSKNKKVLILSNRTELMRQAGNTFSKFGIQPAYVNPSVKNPPFDAPITSAMIQTLRSRLNNPLWQEFIKTRDFIIGDEIHISDIDSIMQSGLISHIPVVGATATPMRTGKQTQLGIMWDGIATGRQVDWHINNGYLVPSKYYSVDPADVSNFGFNPATGDYRTGKMYEVFNSKERYTGLVDNYRTLSDGKKFICFCVNIQHAVKTAVEFHKSGIDVRFLVSGKNKPIKPTEWKNEAQRVKYELELEAFMYLEQYKFLTGDRNSLISDYSKGKFTGLINVDMLTTGFDEPSIETVIVNRSTLSLQLWLQMLGRGSRLFPEKKHFKVLDFGNNASRLGFYEEDREWGLWHLESEGGGVAMTKECPPYKLDFRGNKGCGRLIHISAMICPKCGYQFPTKKQEKEVELKEIVYQKTDETVIATMDYKQLKAYRELKGYHPGWIARELNRRGGEDEVKKGMKAMGYGNGFIYRILKFLN